MNFKNDSSGKQMEWLHYIVASQVEKFREHLLQDKSDKKDDLVGPIFSLIGAFSMANYVNEAPKEIKEIFLIVAVPPIMFLVMYFIVYKVMIVNIFKFFKQLWKKERGYSINQDDEKCKKHVYSINGILSNQILLSNSFIEKFKVAESTKAVREYYLVEALHYLKNPIDEIHLIVCTEKIFKKIVYVDNTSEVIDKNIKAYRLLKLLKIIKYILSYLRDNSEEENSAFNDDLTNICNKFEVIMDKLTNDYNVSIDREEAKA